MKYYLFGGFFAVVVSAVWFIRKYLGGATLADWAIITLEGIPGEGQLMTFRVEGRKLENGGYEITAWPRPNGPTTTFRLKKAPTSFLEVVQACNGRVAQFVLKTEWPARIETDAENDPQNDAES